MRVSWKRVGTYSAYGILLLCVCISIVWAQRLFATSITEREFTHIVRVATLEHEIFIEQTRHALAILSRVDAVRNGNGAACSAFMDGLIGETGRYANLGVIDADDFGRCSALPIPEPFYVGDREYVKRVRSAKTFSVGEYSVGAVTKAPGLNFGYPILGSNGEVERIVFASVRLEWLERLAARITKVPGTSIILVDNKGVELARYPDTNTAGIPAPELASAFERLIAVEQQLGLVELKKQDGTKMVAAAVPLRRPNQEGFLHLIIIIPKTYFKTITDDLFLSAAPLQFIK